MNYYIYLITNIITKKQYIGQTINYEKRIKEHIYGRKNRKNCIIDKAIQKYGKDNFKFELIKKANTQKEIDYLEKKYIKELNTLTPNGYNILKGGRHQQGAWNMKPILVYNLNGNFIREYASSNELERVSNGKYTTRTIRNSCNSKTHKYKDILVKFKEDNSIILPYKRPISKRRKKVIQFDINGKYIKTYQSIQEASQITQTNRTSIIGVLKGNYKTANNFIWRYENDNRKIEKNLAYKIGTKIYQLDDNKNIIRQFKSCTEAQDFLKLKKNSYKNIWINLDKNKKVYGYYWSKVKENPVPSLIK